jgi:hypothetical protein
MKRYMTASVLIFLSILTLTVVLPTGTALAVNFYDGARAKEGTYFLTYSSVYLADTTTDSKGNTTKRDYGLTKADEILRLCYYSPDAVATVLLPFSYINVRSANQESSGLGDINLGAGHFLPFRNVDILPMLFVKFPTGEYGASKSINVGSNQYDIRPSIFLYKAFGDFSIDAAAKYFFRLKNPATDVLPGDEFYLQCLLGYSFSDRFKMGPSLNWMISQDKELNGVKIANSARETFSTGADIYYRFSKIGITFTYLYDFYAKNTTQGHFFQLKTVFRF